MYPQTAGLHDFFSLPLKSTTQPSLLKTWKKLKNPTKVHYKVSSADPNWATKKTLLLSIESRLVNRDPYSGLL